MSKRARLAWFAAVAFVAVFGIGTLLIWIRGLADGPNWWATDVLSIDAARRLPEGAALYADSKYLYPPLAALIAFPLTPLDDWTASLLIAASKVVIAVVCVCWLTPSWRAGDRLLAVIGLVLSLPFLHDVFLGNTNVYIVAAMVPAFFGSPRARSGILLGLVAAAFAKPLVIPVLLWLAVWRRPVFYGAASTGLLATACAIAMTGVGMYQSWVDALRAGSATYSTPFAGNIGVTALAPELWVPVAVAVALGLVLVLWRRGPRVALVWAVTSGVLLAPYAGSYSALPIALALPVIGPLAPAFTLAIVAASPIATMQPLPFYAAAILVVSLALREPIRHARPLSSLGLASRGT